jgi:hypothetical protein
MGVVKDESLDTYNARQLAEVIAKTPENSQID